jgi:hypothetical protein
MVKTIKGVLQLQTLQEGQLVAVPIGVLAEWLVLQMEITRVDREEPMDQEEVVVIMMDQMLMAEEGLANLEFV